MSSNDQPAESLLHDLASSIAGYHGYHIPEDRSQSDQRLRQFLSDRLQQLEQELSVIEHRHYQKNRTARLDTFPRIALSLKMLIQSLKQPACDVDQFFKRSNISEDIIRQLHEYDVQLKNQVDILADEVTELDRIDGEYEIEDMLNHLYDLIDGANQIFSEREFLLMGE